MLAVFSASVLTERGTHCCALLLQHLLALEVFRGSLELLSYQLCPQK